MVTIAFEQRQLSNGLKVILHEDHTIPLTAVNVWYHVGSKDEEVGRTGFAHLFEHVMFEGSKHHNHSHFEPLQKAGANLNGSTTTDRTNYWEDVPSNYLELALWLEADRMGFLLDGLDQQKFDVQRDVVKNERRQSYENRPYGMAHSYLQPALFPLPHPYNWMTIGSQEDLDAASLDDVKNFFQRFYSPSNASLALAGDFHTAEAWELVEKYFGGLPPGEPVARTGRQDSALAGRIDLELRDKVTLPRLYIAWPAPAEGHPDDAPMELLQAVMSDGLASRLYRSLVYEKQIAQSAMLRYGPSEIAGQMLLQVTAAAGHSLEEIEAAVEQELEGLRRHPPTDEEIARCQNRIEAAHYRQLARVGGFGGRADQLNHFSVIEGDPGLINTSLDRALAVQRGDIMRVYDKYLGERQVRLRVRPEAALSPAVNGLDRYVMPPPQAEPAFTPPLPARRRLSNGLGVTVVEQRGMPIVAFGVAVNSGAAGDPQTRPGLAGFTVNLLPEGTQSKSSQELAAAFEFIGARLAADGRREYSLLTTETLTKHWTDGLELLAETLLTPTFPERELERLRREHLTDLRRGKDEPNVVAEQLLPGMLFGPASGYGHPSGGTEAATEAMTRDDLLRQFGRAYGPANAELILVGDIGLDEAVSRAEQVFGGWRNGDTLERRNGPPADPETGGRAPGVIYLVDRPGAPQSVIRAVHPTIPRTHADYFALTLVNYAFGGQFSARLNQNLRQDKGYSYGYQSYIQWHRGASALVAGGSVQTGATKESVAETLREFEEIRTTRPITQEELDGAKDGLLRAYPASFERPAAVLGQLVNVVNFGLPDDYFRTVRPQVAALTLEEVRRVAEECLRPDDLRILVVGDRQTIEHPLSELPLPLVHLTPEG